MTRLLFNCDDFGKSYEVNAAVIQAHGGGVLGSASLMVTGPAFAEAVELARKHPSLKVGLHLALCDAIPALASERICELVGRDGAFHRDPAVAGVRMATRSAARAQAAAEIAAQFEKFAATGLPRAHVDGHYHLHMHPFIFREAVRHAERLGFARIRVAREFGNPLPPRRDGRQFGVKLIRHGIFRALAQNCDRLLKKSSVRRLDGVLGLWETGRMSEDYLLQAIPRLPRGVWEIYVHVGSPGSEEELQAMLSSRLKTRLEKAEEGYWNVKGGDETGKEGGGEGVMI